MLVLKAEGCVLIAKAKAPSRSLMCPLKAAPRTNSPRRLGFANDAHCATEGVTYQLADVRRSPRGNNAKTDPD